MASATASVQGQASALPTSMKAAQVTLSSSSSSSRPHDKSVEANIHVNPSAPVPSKAKDLPKGWTLVKVAYTSLNPVDYKLFEHARIFIPKPYVPCMDFSGHVVSTTRDDLKLGQRVFGKTEPTSAGALAEYLVVGPEGCTALPEGMRMDHAAAVGIAGLTAYQSIAPHVRTGSRVLIVGASGGTGSFGVQIAKALGCRVTAVCSGANADLCKSLGADDVIDYKTQNVVEALIKTAATDKYDLIVDNSAADLGIYWRSAEYLEPDGPYNIVAGNLTLSFAFDMAKVFLWPAVLGGGQRKAKLVMLKANSRQYAEIATLMAEGKVKAIVGETFQLDEVARAFSTLKTGVRGKVVVQVSDDA